ncbi:MAG: pyridoxal-5-phosphate-dependent protein subunit beta [Treponema sp.]|nr:pyridoxal-5-phosphate-dependent protein subunit beta [Treponema sp.]
MIDLTVHKDTLKKTVNHARERNIVIPTFKQMRDPALIPEKIKARLKNTGLWDVEPANLFRIGWHNEPAEKGGGFGGVNFIEFPPELTGVKARIVALVGKWFPTGCHKVGASFSCLVPRLVTGQFDPTTHKAVWPSTGNYCRGGAYNSALLACKAVSILPEGMSRERFEWLREIARNNDGEIIATPGTESNVKEIFDKVWELRCDSRNLVFNQFEEMGNCLWHYHVTGPAMVEAFKKIAGSDGNFAGVCLTSGSGGTLSSGDYVKDNFPHAKIAVSEALQCPTLLDNGFGEHRIEGIGDKHVPWVHNVRNSDMVVAIDDNNPVNLLRLFNEPAGKEYLQKELKLSPDFVEKLSWLGISGIANVLTAIKFAKYYELTGKDVVATVLTDSAVMYGSRLAELTAEKGPYNPGRAIADHERYMLGAGTDNLLELSYADRKRVHNLKYYTWVEQQGRSVDELNAQWYDRNYWHAMHGQVEEVDRLIDSFNAEVGLQ